MVLPSDEIYEKGINPPITTYLQPMMAFINVWLS